MRPFKITLVIALLCTALAVSACGAKSAPPTEPSTVPPTIPAETTEATEPPPTETTPDMVEELTTVVTGGTVYTLNEYTNLKKLDLTGSTCYAGILEYCDTHPGVDVTFTVDLGGTEIGNHAAEITLEDSQYSYDQLLENLQYLREAFSLTLPKTTRSAEELTTLKEAYPEVDIRYTVMILDQEYPGDTSEVNLSFLTSDQVAEAAPQLGRLTNLSFVELMGGKGNLTMTDVKQLVDAAPGSTFHYTFTLFGKTINTNDAKVEFKEVNIGNEGESKIRAALDIMTGCETFMLDSCGIDNDVLDAIRNDYPNTEVAWKVTFGQYKAYTNAETIRAVQHVFDSTCYNLRYCRGVKYMDLGHNETLSDLSFLAYMPNLEILIISGCTVSDISGIENCKNLEFLEMAFCGKLKDISPLAGCENLKHLNISYTPVSDLSPLDSLQLEQFCCKKGRVQPAEQEIFMQIHPDCITNFYGEQPYGKGWRYVDNGQHYTEIYKKVREVFNYDQADAILKALEAAQEAKG